jgi:hypothetical protein
MVICATSGNQLSLDMYREFVGLFCLPPPATSHKGMFQQKLHEWDERDDDQHHFQHQVSRNC